MLAHVMSATRSALSRLKSQLRCGSRASKTVLKHAAVHATLSKLPVSSSTVSAKLLPSLNPQKVLTSKPPKRNYFEYIYGLGASFAVCLIVRKLRTGVFAAAKSKNAVYGSIFEDRTQLKLLVRNDESAAAYTINSTASHWANRRLTDSQILHYLMHAIAKIESSAPLPWQPCVTLLRGDAAIGRCAMHGV